MSEAGIIALAVAITGLIGGSGGLVAWLSQRAEKQKNYVDQALAGLDAALKQEKESRKELTARVDTLEAEREKDSRWIAALRDHIYRQKPPPPPDRPT
jgi:uncharacterized protein HemX